VHNFKLRVFVDHYDSMVAAYCPLSWEHCYFDIGRILMLLFGWQEAHLTFRKSATTIPENSLFAANLT